MQIVIEISDTLKNIADNEDVKTFSHIIWQALLMDAIKNGEPLPKGHGRLIDADELKQVYENTEDSQICKWSTYGVISEIDDAPTVIEADGGAE